METNQTRLSQIVTMVLKSLGFHRLKKHSSSSKRPYPTVIEELCHQFFLADLRKATNNFDKSNVIGKGDFGKLVYKGCLQLDHVATAVMVKRMTTYFEHGVEELKREIELLCQLRHPNLISLIGFCIHKDYNLSVFEHMSNGSLADRLFKRDDDREPLSWKKRLEICIGAARGLHYLHSGLKRTIIHRDFKPSNILLDDNMVPKLSDFELSIQGALFKAKPKPIQVEPDTDTYVFAGYMPPEYVRNSIVTDKCDVYSFGMVLLEVVCAKPIHKIVMEMFEFPRESREIARTFESLYADKHTYIMSRLQVENIDPALIGNIAPLCYAAYIDIIDRCTKLEPNERSTMGEVEVLLEHALALQQEADLRDTSVQQPQQEAPI